MSLKFDNCWYQECSSVTPLKRTKLVYFFLESTHSRLCIRKAIICETCSIFQSALAEIKLSAVNSKGEFLEKYDTAMIIII